MNCSCGQRGQDNGGNPEVMSVCRAAHENRYFRRAVWTGEYLQMTVMSIPSGGEIGEEVHRCTDQLLIVEEGSCEVRMGECRGSADFCRKAGAGSAIFIPAGYRHNVVNTGRCELKLISVYAPPNHQAGVVHKTKADADRAER